MLLEGTFPPKMKAINVLCDGIYVPCTLMACMGFAVGSWTPILQWPFKSSPFVFSSEGEWNKWDLKAELRLSPKERQKGRFSDQASMFSDWKGLQGSKCGSFFWVKHNPANPHVHQNDLNFLSDWSVLGKCITQTGYLWQGTKTASMVSHV